MIAAYYIIHYGREWFNWSLRSIRDYVDEIFVFYTPTPSHGHLSDLDNPERRDELYNISIPYNVHWRDCQQFRHEGEHREFAVHYCVNAGADEILVVDADEIWRPVFLERVLEDAKISESRVHRVNMAHFWRSTKWVCYDEAFPTRIIMPKLRVDTPEKYHNHGKVFHFGYAQSPDIIKYKMSIHGHKAEWRGDWFDSKFLAWQPGVGDVHPTNKNYWYPELYNDFDGELEKLIGDHPYCSVDIIGQYEEHTFLKTAG